MDTTSAEFEAELLDLSTVDVANLRSVPAADLETSAGRVKAQITDAEGSISGYTSSFAGQLFPATKPESI
jgi:hypothetical protein